jgi:CHASE2 domain-containing sensor protein
MKRSIIISSGVTVLGLLIALGPQFLFKVCSQHGSYTLCHWTAQAELGMGMIIAALGFCLIVFNDPKTQIGITIGILLVSIMVIGLPYALLGGCTDSAMPCKRVAFPALAVEGAILLVYSIIVLVYNEMKKTPSEESEKK